MIGLIVLCLLNPANALFGGFKSANENKHEEIMMEQLTEFAAEQAEFMAQRQDELAEQDREDAEKFVDEFKADANAFREEQAELLEEVVAASSAKFDALSMALVGVVAGREEIDDILMNAQTVTNEAVLELKKEYDQFALEMAQKYTQMYLSMSVSSQAAIKDGYDHLINDLEVLRSDWRQVLIYEYQQFKTILSDIINTMGSYVGELFNKISNDAIHMNEEMQAKLEAALKSMKTDSDEFNDALQAAMAGMAEGTKEYILLMKEYRENQDQLEYVYREQLMEYMVYEAELNASLQMETQQLSQALLSDLMSYLNYQSTSSEIFELAEMKLKTDAEEIEKDLETKTIERYHSPEVISNTHFTPSNYPVVAAVPNTPSTPPTKASVNESPSAVLAVNDIMDAAAVSSNTIRKYCTSLSSLTTMVILSLWLI